MLFQKVNVVIFFALLMALSVLACGQGGGGGDDGGHDGGDDGGPLPVNHTLSVSVSGGGSVTSSPSGINCTAGNCVAPFLENTVVDLTALPES